MYASTDCGETWHQLQNILSDEIIMDIEIAEGKIFASCFWKGLFVSTDEGNSFNYLGFATKSNYGIFKIFNPKSNIQ